MPVPPEEIENIQRGGFASRGIGVYYDLGQYDTGSVFDGAHGALADVIANVRVAQGLINGWFSIDVMNSIMVDAADKAEALATMLRCFNAPPRAMVGHDGWIRRISLRVHTRQALRPRHRGGPPR